MPDNLCYQFLLPDPGLPCPAPISPYWHLIQIQAGPRRGQRPRDSKARMPAQHRFRWTTACTIHNQHTMFHKRPACLPRTGFVGPPPARSITSTRCSIPVHTAGISMYITGIPLNYIYMTGISIYTTGIYT
jgi:hypothetical protein